MSAHGFQIVLPHAAFQQAATFVLRYHGHTDLRLIHGTRDADGEADAWVEVGDRVIFDARYQRFYDRASYEAIVGTTKQVAYDQRAVAERVRDTGHYGPWPTAPADS